MEPPTSKLHPVDTDALLASFEKLLPKETRKKKFQRKKMCERDNNYAHFIDRERLIIYNIYKIGSNCLFIL